MHSVRARPRTSTPTAVRRPAGSALLRLKLEYRADFFNALNHTNFAVLARNRSENNGAFGTLSGTSTFNGGDTGGLRVIQMTLRLQF